MDWKARLLINAGLMQGDGEVSHEPDLLRQPAALWSALFVIISYVLLLAACGWTLVGFIWDRADPASHWFQRSGAVLVAASLLMEFLVPWVMRYQAPVIGFHPTPLYFRMSEGFRLLGVLLAAVGTCIWAYGDILL